MKMIVKSVLLIVMISFGNICGENFNYSWKRTIMEDTVIDANNLDKIEEMWIELGIPTEAESKEVFQKNVMKWFANSENQRGFLDKLQSQLSEEQLVSPEIKAMFQSIKDSLNEWSKAYDSQEIVSKKVQNALASVMMSCHHKGIKDSDDVDESNVAEYVEQLREEEKAHKDEALELVLQFGGEALGAGISAAGGVAPLAVYEGVQASRHLVQGCREYNEGVRYQQKADELEEKYHLRDEEESNNKSWWKIWK